jgi:hypothetical protein
MKSRDVPSDLLNTKCEGQEKPGAPQSKQAEVEHGRKLKQARESERGVQGQKSKTFEIPPGNSEEIVNG